jgi:hypothetical protein
MRLFAPAMLALLASCGAPNVALSMDKGCIRTVRLDVDEAFTGPEREEISKAIREWGAASNGRLCFRTAWRNTSMDKPTFRTDGRLTVYSPHRAWQVRAAMTVEGSPCPRRGSCLAVTVWEYGGRASDIFVLTERLGFLRATLEHELGHMFGLRHTLEYDSIMFSSIRTDKTIGAVDRKGIDCLLRTYALMRHDNNCAK